jgi:hypothetical protein
MASIRTTGLVILAFMTAGCHAAPALAPVPSAPEPTPTTSEQLRPAVQAHPAPAGLQGLSLAVAAEVVTGADGADVLHARAVLRNENAEAIYIEYGACALDILGFRTAAAGAPVWRSERRQPWDGTSFHGCPLYLATATIEPGADFSPEEFTVRIPAIELLGDTLPDGSYHLAGRLHVNRDTLRADAGIVVLRAVRAPLPATRRYQAVTWSARTEVVARRPTLVRAEAVATLTHASGITTAMSVDCPVSLLVYESRERRDAAPLAGEPAARAPRSCGPAVAPVAFSAPDPRGNPRRDGFALQPGAPVPFRVEASAADLLGEGLPEGRYYFAVAVPLAGRTLYLSAGEAVLRR